MADEGGHLNGQAGCRRPGAPAPAAGEGRQQVAEVFQPTGVPGVTFTRPAWFAEFRLALRQPGLNIIVEGPSGSGKTTLLQYAIAQDSRLPGEPARFMARDPADIAAIGDLVSGHHQGIAVIDDFQRLPGDVQSRVTAYLEQLADWEDRTRKLVIAGRPPAAQPLFKVGFDTADRVCEFRLGRAPDRQVLELVEQGEKALNIVFGGKPALVAAAGGSLITAQSLCWHLVSQAGVEETLPGLTAVPADLDRACRAVFRELRLKYRQAVTEFTGLGDRGNPACIDLLLALAAEPEGVLYLDALASRHPGLARRARRALAAPASEAVSRVLHYDSTGRRLITEDPQFEFYIRHLGRQELLRESGKYLPTRHRVFICYSRANSAWLDRLLVHLGPLDADLVDVWSDKRIRTGDSWRDEIDAALATARVAVLLVSADFYNSAFIREVELPRLLAASSTGGCKVIPVLVSASRFQSDPSLSRFQAAARNGRTLAAMTPEEAEQTLASLAAEIEESCHPN
jgi:hypothetical protein